MEDVPLLVAASPDRDLPVNSSGSRHPTMGVVIERVLEDQRLTSVDVFVVRLDGELDSFRAAAGEIGLRAPQAAVQPT